MKLDYNRHNCLLKQGLRFSRDPSLTLETLRLSLTVRNDSISFDHDPNVSKLQVITGRKKQPNNIKEKYVRSTECMCLLVITPI